MKIIVKKTVLILLTVLALLSAASCSGSGDPQPGRTEEEQKAPAGADVGSSVSEMSPGTSADAGEIYARELIMVPDADVYLSQAVKAGGSIYMYGKISRETPVLYRMDIGSRQVERVELPPERVDTICPSVVGEIGALCISEEGEFIAATLGSDGTWSRLTLPAAEEYGYDTLMQAVPVSKGYVVFTTGSILAVDMQGGLIKELGSYYREAVCVPLEDGRAAIAAPRGPRHRGHCSRPGFQRSGEIYLT